MNRLFSLLIITCVFWVSSYLAVAQGVEHKPTAFDSYGAIGSDDASARLDNFAIELQNRPDMIGFVISYGPQGEGSGTGDYLLRVTKDYFINTRGLEPDRIQTIYAGRYKDPREIFTQLWLVPVGASPPEPPHYKTKPKAISGKFSEGDGWDGSGVDECGCGPSFGNVTLAAFGDVLREQRKDIGYIVASNVVVATPGAWRRVAKRDAAELQEDGIQADRIKIIYGGTLKAKGDEYAQVKLEFWILPADAPPPVKEAKPERTPKEAVQLGSYSQYSLKYPKDERLVFEGFADVLRADEQLSVCIIVRSELPSVEEYVSADEPDVDQSKLVETWKSELQEKFGIKDSRIFIIQAGAREFNGGTIEVWIVPPGASLPDPYESTEDMNEDP
ncbi:MAG: hypothetical protein M3Y84_00355 [Acidobacteriota bacterium]|nr:hypothetical protein [Acidobacteriota bacterium]